MNITANKGIRKIRNKLKLIMEALRLFPDYRKEFGISPAITMLRRKASLISVQDYIERLSSYVEKEIEPVTCRYNEGKVFHQEKKIHTKCKIVWVCWFQGEKQLPEVCKLCISHLRKIIPNTAELVFLSNANYKEYIDFPNYINEKYEAGIISPSNFSDILRYGLLSIYGGVWVDAAILLTGSVLEQALGANVFSIRFYDKYNKLLDASRGRWIGGFWGGTDNTLVFKYCYEALLYFWDNHNLAIEYLACDYIIWTGYTRVKEIKDEIDSIPVNNKNIRRLNDSLNLEYSCEELTAVLKSNDIHLINRHLNYKHRTSDGNLTIYGFLVQQSV